MHGRSGSSGSIDVMVGREALLDSACGALRHRLVEAIAVVGYASQAAAACADEQPAVLFWADGDTGAKGTEHGSSTTCSGYGHTSRKEEVAREAVAGSPSQVMGITGYR